MKKNPSTKQIILDVIRMRNYVISHIDKSKKYYPIFKILTAKDYINSEDSFFPNVKILSEMTGISYDATRKLLVDGYIDIYNQTDDHPIEIKNCIYDFHLIGYEDSIYLNFKNLPVLPRVGESITIPHFKALVGSDWFFVENIKHEFEDQDYIIRIILRTGSYNLYRRFKIDEAEEKKWIRFRESLKYK
jgi:hypothetical protein